MENLRWILIFAGVAILALLYFSGRGSSVGKTRAVARPRPDEFDQEDLMGAADPLLGHPGQSDRSPEPAFDGFDEVDPDDLARPGAARDYLDTDDAHQGSDYHDVDDGYLPPELETEERDGGGLPATASAALGGLTQKIETIGARLSGKSRERVAAPRPRITQQEQAYASKIITLHVVAQRNGNHEGRFDGQALLDTFEQRDFQFGEMNIFHSMHHGKTVFSIAKMVEPGWFDPHDIDSFSTPGITLILQLPGPVAADTAFEVLLSEAFEIANELDGTVLDGDRSTLSKQTAQHMREGIYEYMHRQKYFGSVTS